MHDLVALYQDPMFCHYSMGILTLFIVVLLLFATPYTVLAWIDPPRLRRHKVQDKSFEVEKYFRGANQRSGYLAWHSGQRVKAV